MQNILIRNLRRRFQIGSEWGRTPFAALQTAPEIDEVCAPPVETITIEPQGRLFRMVTPEGRTRTGTLRDLAARIDVGIMQQGFRTEAAQFLLLPAAVLRGPSAVRSAFVGPGAAGKTWLSLSLIERGWRFEGDGWALVHDKGVTSLPRTLRVGRVPPHLAPSLSAAVAAAPSLRFDPRAGLRAIDPGALGSDWRIGSGAVSHIAFLEMNQGGCGDLRGLGADESFGRALALCRGSLGARSLIALRNAIAGARTYRLRLGDPRHVADLIVDHLKYEEGGA